MAVATAALDVQDRREEAASRARLSHRPESVVVLGGPTQTNLALVEAFDELTDRARLGEPTVPSRVGPSDVVLARLDVCPTLDGIEPGLW